MKLIEKIRRPDLFAAYVVHHLLNLQNFALMYRQYTKIKGRINALSALTVLNEKITLKDTLIPNTPKIDLNTSVLMKRKKVVLCRFLTETS